MKITIGKSDPSKNSHITPPQLSMRENDRCPRHDMHAVNPSRSSRQPIGKTRKSVRF